MPEFPIPSARILLLSKIQGGRLPSLPPCPVRLCSFDPLSSRSPQYECIKFGYPLQNARFLLLSSNLARERLQVDTNSLPNHNKHCWRPFQGINIDDLKRPWNRKIAGFSEFFADEMVTAGLAESSCGLSPCSWLPIKSQAGWLYAVSAQDPALALSSFQGQSKNAVEACQKSPIIKLCQLN